MSLYLFYIVALLTSSCVYSLQHEFIRSCTDPKPIRELIAEFKAEVIEEEEKLDAKEELKVSDVVTIHP